MFVCVLCCDACVVFFFTFSFYYRTTGRSNSIKLSSQNSFENFFCMYFSRAGTCEPWMAGRRHLWKSNIDKSKLLLQFLLGFCRKWPDTFPLAELAWGMDPDQYTALPWNRIIWPVSAKICCVLEAANEQSSSIFQETLQKVPSCLLSPASHLCFSPPSNNTQVLRVAPWPWPTLKIDSTSANQPIQATSIYRKPLVILLSSVSSYVLLFLQFSLSVVPSELMFQQLFTQQLPECLGWRSPPLLPPSKIEIGTIKMDMTRNTGSGWSITTMTLVSPYTTIDNLPNRQTLAKLQ